MYHGVSDVLHMVKANYVNSNGYMYVVMLVVTECFSFSDPGSHLIGGGMVTQPPGHYTANWKPANHDPKQIFVSPSIKYCSFRDVYTKKKGCVYLINITQAVHV